MSDLPNPKDAANLLNELRRGQEISHRRVEEGELPPQMALLRAWQTARLARTHADLLISDRFGPACRFFLDDIYAPRDFTQRNHDIVRIHDFMMRFLPAGVLRTLTKAIELNSLTEELDQALLTALVDELGISDTITGEQYAEGYRICDNYAGRAYQIQLIVEVGRGIERLVRIPLIGWTLRLARGPAHRGGWHELQGFLDRGFAAFKRLGNAGSFLQTIERRESQILEQIFTGSADPFSTI